MGERARALRRPLTPPPRGAADCATTDAGTRGRMNRKPARAGRRYAVALVVVACGIVVACGSRTEPTDLLAAHDAGNGAFTGAGGSGAGGRVAAAGAASSGRPGSGGRAVTTAAGGKVSAGGARPAAGGTPPASGGAPPAVGGATSEDARIRAFVCREPCDAKHPCPSAAPYAGGCNQVGQRCMITCEKGCPPGMVELVAAGGCLCYIPDVYVTGQAENGVCCGSTCGPPYNLACCSGYACQPNGECCRGNTCLVPVDR
jgi:hypothetical protein